MTVTIRYWEKEKGSQINYHKRHERRFSGKNAKECMNQVRSYIYDHDLVKYTEAEIINIED